MHTIQLKIQDSIYDKLMSGGVDIQAKFDELVYDMLDDGYPSITTQEANKRVSDAVDRYKNGTGTYITFDKIYQDDINKYIENL